MYGLIFTTLQSLIVNKICGGNDEKWKEICMKSGINRVEFYNNQYYDEDFLDKLVKAASEVLNIELDKALEAFGDEFFQKTKVSGHSHMLKTLGNNLFGFLVNLDFLHSHLSYTYLDMQAPSFQCDVTDKGLQLHYYSHRYGLHPVVTGIVKAVAKDFFSLEIDIIKNIDEKLVGVKRCYHYGFEITVKECSKDDTWLERLQGEKSVNLVPMVLQFSQGYRNSTNLNVLLDDSVLSRSINSALQSSQCPFQERSSEDESDSDKENDTEEVDGATVPPSKTTEGESTDTNNTSRINEDEVTVDVAPISLRHLFPNHLSHSPAVSRGPSRRASIFIPTDDWPITVVTFRTCFPFHVIFDSNLVITFMGVSMSRLFPNAMDQKKKLSDLFEVDRPAIPEMTYNHIKSRSHNQFVLRAKKTAKSDSNLLLFRGQMVPVTQRSPFSQILFLGSPRVQEIEELKKHGLYLSDIPIHDVTREMILLHHQLKVEMNYVTELERMRNLLEEEKARVKKEKDRADHLLHAMLPESVARELKEGKGAQATFHPEVTILFSDIEGFTTICNKCHPLQVVTMLNDIYTKFDSHIDECGVYKVETIGDAYMVAAGLLETSKTHGYAVTKFSFFMREEAQSIKRPTDDTPLRIRIGIHSGAVMAGVVGMRMPRYCLFGDTVNLASRMESHGEPGKIHISENTYRLLQDRSIRFICRGKIRVKGLERRKMTYFVEPLAPGEEAVTEYLPVESNDGSTDDLNSSSMASMTGKPIMGDSISLKKNRSPSLSTNASFSLIESPMNNSDLNLLWRKSYSSQKKISIESNTSINQMVTVPIIEESSGNSSTSLPNNNNIRRNQISPLCTNEDEVTSDSSFKPNTAFDEDDKLEKGKHQRSRKKCTIC